MSPEFVQPPITGGVTLTPFGRLEPFTPECLAYMESFEHDMYDADVPGSNWSVTADWSLVETMVVPSEGVAAHHTPGLLSIYRNSDVTPEKKIAVPATAVTKVTTPQVAPSADEVEESFMQLLEMQVGQEQPPAKLQGGEAMLPAARPSEADEFESSGFETTEDDGQPQNMAADANEVDCPLGSTAHVKPEGVAFSSQQKDISADPHLHAENGDGEHVHSSPQMIDNAA